MKKGLILIWSSVVLTLVVVFSAEAQRAEKPGTNKMKIGVGMYIPGSIKGVVEIPSLENTRKWPLLIFFLPDLLLGLKIGMTPKIDVEPLIGLYSITEEEESNISFNNKFNNEESIFSLFGFSIGGKVNYIVARSERGKLYLGSSLLISYASESGEKENPPIIGNTMLINKMFGFHIFGHFGVEGKPFKTLSNLSFTFDVTLPALGYASLTSKYKGVGATGEKFVSRFNFIEKLPIFLFGMHIYF